MAAPFLALYTECSDHDKSISRFIKLFEQYNGPMTSLIRQTGLLPAGCQPWNLNMVASCGPNFAYCATLAVYIYEFNEKLGEYKLSSISSSHSKTITCISWNAFARHLFVTAAADQRVCVWDVTQRKCVATYDKLSYAPVCIGWLPGKSQSSVVAFCGKRGAVTLWNTSDQSTSQVDYTNAFEYDVTIFRWHHTDPAKFIFGHTDGSISLFISGKRTKHALRASEASSYKDNDPVLAALWDPHSPDYVLVARKQSGVQLVDVKAGHVITTYVMPSKMLSTLSLSWVDSAPGTFITGDHESGVLRLWSASQPLPLESFSLKATGFHCLVALDGLDGAADVIERRDSSSTSQRTRAPSLPPARVVCAFADGGVGLYNLRQRKWELLRDQSHIETIFDCKFKPGDAKTLATASFDGTVKVWSVDALAPLHTSAGNEGVIYSIAWAPGDLNCIACATRRRGVLVWDIDKGKMIRRFKEHGMRAVYCVAWNQRDSHRLASCAEDGYCVVRRLDGELVAKFAHPDAAFGCEWNAIDKDLLATGCDDAIVRVWTLSSGHSDKPYRTLAGHSAKVFNVRWNPLIRNILCSGSDDTTVRVWELESGTCSAVLEGHTAPVRGLAWNCEFAPLLASGSWDSALKLWDVRDGKCIETVRDHGADVYGLATHPLNPFTMATSSRDSTLRIWSLAPVTKSLFLKVVAGLSPTLLVASPEASMQAGAPLQLSGSMSRQLLSQLQERKNQEPVKLRWFSELFCSSRKLENLWDLASVVRGQRETSLSASYKKGILHAKHLTKYKASEAQELEHTVAHKSGMGSRHREESLKRVADSYMKLGNMRRHCEILAQLGHWERALSLAPSVSMAFWSELAKRYADVLLTNNDDAAASFMVATASVSEAVAFMTSQSEFQDALLVAQSAHEGNSPSPILPPVATSNTNGDATDNDDCSELVRECYAKLAERHYNGADPYTAASLHLAHDDSNAAIDCLVKANKLPLALCLARNLKGRFEATPVAARMVALKCERDGEYETAMRILLQFLPDASSSSKLPWSPLHATCARCEGGSDVKDALHKSAGLPSSVECRKLAEKLKDEGSNLDAARHHVISDQPQAGLELGVDLLLRKLSDDVSWTVDDVLEQFEFLYCVRSDVLKLQSNKIHRSKLLAVCAYVGALLAYRRDYYVIVKPMFQYAISLCKLARSLDDNFPLHPDNIQDEMDSLDGGAGDRMRAGTERTECLKGAVVAHASDLPSHSDGHTSTISRRKISGAAFFLEDGRSVLSLNEAIMWARCNPFSPTASGVRICPC